MRLKDISQLNPQYQGDFLNASVSFVPMESLRNGSIDLQEIPFADAKGKYTFFANGDLLIAKVTPCFENGNIAIAENLKEGIGFGSSEIFVLRTNELALNTYMFYVSQTSKFQDAACATMCGVGGLKRISPLFMRTYEIDLPSTAKQQQIIDYLDEKCSEIDEQVEVLEKKRKAYERLKTSVINNAVTRGLNPDVPMRDSGIDWIGEIPDHWETLQMKRKFTFGKGLSISKADLVESGQPVISYGQIHAKNNTGTKVEDHLLRFVPFSYTTGNESAAVKKGDFIFADTSEDLAGCGNCVYIDKDGIYAGYHAVIARCNTSDNRYFAYLFLSNAWRNQIRSLVYGVKVYSMTKVILGQSFILIPPIEEQLAIATYLDEKCGEIDTAIENIGKQIEAFKRLKRALINEVVTGKRAV